VAPRPVDLRITAASSGKSARLGRRPLQGLFLGGLRGALEDDGGFAVVGGALPFVEAAFFGHADGGGVIGVNQADGAGIGEVDVAPGEDGSDGFGGVALAVHSGRENPAGFAKIFDGRDEFAMEIGETDFPGEVSGGFLLEDPEAETEVQPVAGVAEELDPGFFFGKRPSADELGYGGVGPHGAAGGEIFQAMVAKTEARSFDDGKFRRRAQRWKHEKILAQGGANFGMDREKEGVEGEVAKR
jgi:hypothetical protein